MSLSFAKSKGQAFLILLFWPFKQGNKNGKRRKLSYERTFENLRPKTGSDVGDVNMDGGINILDATLVQKYVVGIVELSAEQKHLADYNNDGDITVVDATEIQKFIVHLN